MSVDESEFASPTSGQPASAGQRLAAAREAAGLTLAELSARTKISERHLGALETGDFAALPGRTYVFGFTRTFAKSVGLDPATLVDAMGRDYSRAAPEPEVPASPAFAPGDPARVPSSRFAWMAGFVLLVAAIGGFIWWQNNSRSTDSLPSLIPDEVPSAVPSQAASAAPSEAPSAEASSAPTGPVVLTAQMDKLWIKVSDADGKQLVQKQLAMGETYTLPEDAKDPRVWTGRPDKLAITVGGQDVPPISKTPEIVKNVPISAKALLERGQPAPAATPAAGLIPGAANAPVAAPSPVAAPRPLRHFPRPRPAPTADAQAAPAAPATPSTVTP
ncbi:cytoskeletal protein RodZ [Novosphingobium sp. SG751A]|uniref:helix-turn-helix domain-containing protein n=1 Tax=Novosphingobium sp. SG751A TaxID=2587000 RepID=UPI001555780F|nr:helix-turn-helix domain-containing protein [Novosphingobium sp. SG751A]NOW46156.1 cytoskeletal protein RodZ [Novosphingobium sp. SG751A]